MTNLRVVLVSPLYAGNVGSVCRAMANMGASDLWVVAPRIAEKDWEEGERMACHAGAILAARFRKGGDLIWTCWLLSVIAFFSVCLCVKAIPFSPWVTATQKVLIVSFAIWTGWLAWHVRRNESVKSSPSSPCADELADTSISCC